MDTKRIKDFIFQQKTTLLFVFLCIGGIYAANQPISFVLNELLARIGRNGFVVLSLLLPIQAGMGLNFAIVIGAMSAQIAVFLVVLWGIPGPLGFLVCVAISVPTSILFGYLTGVLFNSMKGSEMIGGIILGFFADGIYQFIFLFVIGGVIAVNAPKIMIPGGVGVKNTIDLAGGLRYSIDGIYRMSLLDIVMYVSIILIIYYLIRLIRNHRSDLKSPEARGYIIRLVVAVAVIGSTYIPYVETLLWGAKVPVVTYGLIALLCLFNTTFMKTLLGQNMRAVGQSMHIATASGINVDKTRIIAITMSTVIAGWGQLIYLQNMGTLQTYGAHTNTGLFAIASLLVGGASVHKASNKQAILGVILFHTLFIVSPIAGKNLFDSAQMGEYFRVFVSYGVIAVTLALHAWKSVKKKYI